MISKLEALLCRPILDNFNFRLYFKDQPKNVEYVLNPLLKHFGKGAIGIKSALIEHRLISFGHDAVLDVFAESNKGEKINIEFQVVEEAYPISRIRYYASMLDTNSLEEGTDYSKLPKQFLVYLCAFDPFKKGAPAYIVEKTLKYNHKGCIPYEDGQCIIFANATFRDESGLGKMLSDLMATNPDRIHNPALAERMYFLNQTFEGRKIMKDTLDAYVEEQRKRAAEIAVQKALAHRRREEILEKVEIIRFLLTNNVPFEIAFASTCRNPENEKEVLKHFPEYAKNN